MSTTQITIERVNEVEPHPNADRLDLIQVLGYKVITGRGEFAVGDAVVYFPPDMLIPDDVANELGVAKYLKHAVYPGAVEKSQCRVAACRLRGVPSHGFVIRAQEFTFGPDSPFGQDVTEAWGGSKYEPPVRAGAGDAASEWAIFHQYTGIENVQRFPGLIPEGTECRFTEKIHGTNSRIGWVHNPEDSEGGMILVAGSHKRRIKQPGDGGASQSLYWQVVTVRIQEMLKACATVCNDDVIVFGEIFGPGVQDLDYGQSEKVLRVFDISVNGQYLNWAAVNIWCSNFGIPVVPLLYEGPFSLKKVEELTYGDTTFKNPKSKFKGREGVVVTPVVEQVTRAGRRMIVKSVSADYRDRKGAKDEE